MALGLIGWPAKGTSIRL